MRAPEWSHPELKLQAKATVGYAIRIGELEKGPCRVCGVTKDVEAHHQDYSKPFEIFWFCRKHHKTWHEFLSGEPKEVEE